MAGGGETAKGSESNKVSAVRPEDLDCDGRRATGLAHGHLPGRARAMRGGRCAAMRIYMLLVDAPRAPFPPCETGRSSQSADLPDSPGAADSAATDGSQVPSQGSGPTETVPSLERFRATYVWCEEWMAAGSGDLHGGLQVVLLLTFSCWARPASASGGRLGRANTIRSGQEALRVQQGKGV